MILLEKLKTLTPLQKLDPEFHWLRQITTTLRQFHW